MKPNICSTFRVLTMLLMALAIPLQSHAVWSSSNTINNAISTDTGMQYSPHVVSDGSGGAIIAWEDYRNGNSDIFAQRIDADGTLQWTANGVPLSIAGGNQTNAQIVSDGNGGAIITWQDERNGSINPDIYAQRIDAVGTVQWAANGVPIATTPAAQYYPQLVSDGSGGAIITWGDYRRSLGDIYAQRIDANGTAQWAADGVIISTSSTLRQWSPQIVTDGSGGAIIAWGLQDNYWRVYGQRVNGSGIKQWVTGPNGVSISGFNSTSQLSFAVASDGAGGAVFCWLEGASGPNWNMSAQRINGSGSKYWGENGVLAATFGDAATPVWNQPRDLNITSDGLGGGIFAWTDERSGFSQLYARRVAANGTMQWTANGTVVHPEPANLPRIINDGNGVIITWVNSGSAGRNIYAQRYGLDGNVVWGTQVSMATDDQTSPQIVSAGSGKSIITWSDYRNASSAPDIYAQKLLANGTLPIRYLLTANAAGNGAGNVASGNGTINYSYPAANTGSTLIDAGDAVTLTASAATGSTVAWTGACNTLSGTATTANCTITSMDAAKTVIATFTLNQYQLTANATGNGAGGVTSSSGGISVSYPAANSGTAMLNHGTSAILTASAAANSTVVWSGSCDSTSGSSTVATCTINSMVAARTVTATFTLNQYQLTVTAAGSGAGVVTSNAGNINYTYPAVSSGAASIAHGTPVTLTATASGNSTAAWTGNCSATGGTADAATCTITSMDSARTVNATFTLKNQLLTVRKVGTGSGDVTPDSGTLVWAGSTGTATYIHGSQVVLTAVGTGSNFTGWTGCTSSSGNQCTVAMTSTRNVTAIFLGPWEWSADPRINTPICTAVGEQNSQQTTSDGTGGAIIVWTDSRDGDWLYNAIYARRVDGSGKVLWAQDGIAIAHGNYGHYGSQIVSDDSGGAIITWYDRRNGEENMDVFAQRVDADGTMLWATSGVPISTAAGHQHDVQMVSDGSGGAILTWMDARTGDARIYAQRIDPNGNVLWAVDGVPVCPLGSTQQVPQIVQDGTGGAVITWIDYRDNKNDIYGQRIDPNGSRLWSENGVAISTVTNTNPIFRALEGDGTGGAIMVWTDDRNGASDYDIYAQKITADGTLSWTAGGVAIAAVAGSNQMYPAVAGNDSDGYFIAWTDARNGNSNWDVHAQKIAASGSVQWAPDGVAISSAPWSQGGRVLSDGNGGAIIAWLQSAGYFAQRVDTNGTAQWNPAGVPIATSDCDKQGFNMISDGNGGAVLAWGDYRTCTGREIDIYAQKVLANGTLPTTVDTPPTITGFTIPSTATSATVTIITFTASDNNAVSDYCLTETNSSSGCSWSGSAPTSYTFSGIPDGIPTGRTLYAWARDAVGNVSATVSASITITLPDSTAPTVTAFTIPTTGTTATIGITSFTAIDNVAVTGFCLSETNSSSGCTWQAAAPASYTFSGIPDGIATARTLYAWARDAAGNVSAGISASVTITLADSTAPSVTAFSIPASSTAATINITSLTASDNVAVSGYCLTETNSSSGCTWQGAPQSSYSFGGIPDGIATGRTLYAWARDAAGNVSVAVARSVTITLPDITAPSVTAFAIPATGSSFTVPITTFTATDNVAVSGYCLSETSSSGSCSWSATKPASFTVSGEGSVTVYAWVRDAAGNNSAVAQGVVTVTIAKGDIDGDGVAGISDVLTVFRSIVQGVPLTPAELARADVAPVGAPNGVVDIYDVIILLRKLVGL